MSAAIPIQMSAEAYLFSISRADAEALQQLRREIAADETLDLAERRELQAAINSRFGQLNLLAAGTMKPRWN